MKNNINKRKTTCHLRLLGFILIIIFINSGVLVPSIVHKAIRDAKRIVAIDTIAQALEVSYGNKDCGATVDKPYCNNSTFPSNPSPGGSDYTGLPDRAVSGYTICALLETSIGNYDDRGNFPNNISKGAYYCRKNNV